MISLRDSGKIVGRLVSITRLARRCGLAFPLSLRDFIRAPGCPFPRCNRLHIKVLTEPADHSIEAMLSSMREVYATAGIRVEIVSREELTGPEFATLNDVDINSELNELFSNQNGVPVGERGNQIVVYFVRSIVFGKDMPTGVAEHPKGQPGVVVAEAATTWTLAHEVGHVLGLGHVAGEHEGCPRDDPETPDNESKCCSTPDITRLMTGCGTDRIEETPRVDQKEVNQMKRSDVTQKC